MSDNLRDVIESKIRFAIHQCMNDPHSPDPEFETQELTDSVLPIIEAREERLREIMTPEQVELDGIGITWQSRAKRISKRLTQTRAERDAALAKVARVEAVLDDWRIDNYGRIPEWVDEIREALANPDAASGEAGA